MTEACFIEIDKKYQSQLDSFSEKEKVRVGSSLGCQSSSSKIALDRLLTC